MVWSWSYICSACSCLGRAYVESVLSTKSANFNFRNPLLNHLQDFLAVSLACSTFSLIVAGHVCVFESELPNAWIQTITLIFFFAQQDALSSRSVNESGSATVLELHGCAPKLEAAAIKELDYLLRLSFFLDDVALKLLNRINGMFEFVSLR